MIKRIRIFYDKVGPLCYTSNLDLHKMLERMMRRAHIPVAYTQGFHPQPRINQACPLPLGLTSNAEIIDVWINGDLTLLEIENAFRQASPPGFEIQRVKEVDLSLPAIQTQVIASEYQITFLEEVDFSLLETRIHSLMEAESIRRERRGKTYDLRPFIEDLCLEHEPDLDNPHMIMRLSAREGATGRADETLDALGIDPMDSRITRTKLFFLDNSKI